MWCRCCFLAPFVVNIQQAGGPETNMGLLLPSPLTPPAMVVNWTGQAAILTMLCRSSRHLTLI